MARLAAIDIGSNAIRLRVVDVDPPVMTDGGARFHAFRDVLVDRAPVRLGHDVFTKGYIETSVIGAACEALRRFRTSMDAAKVDRYRAVATSAAREAKNGDLFVERSLREAGIHVEVIEGVEEARLVQLAIVERVALEARTALLVDIGGGSTELTLLRDKKPMFSRSLPVGTVRLVEAFLEDGGPVDRSHRRLVEEYVDRVCTEAVREALELSGGRVDQVLGTGGNIETLADLCPMPSAFPEGRAIEVRAMRELLEVLSQKTVDERAAAYALRPDRADTIIPAGLVLSRLAELVGVTSLGAPGVGLKEGVLVDLAREHFLPRDVDFPDPSAITDACLRLGRRYHFHERHGIVVAQFATQIFDALAGRHRMTPRDRLLLQAASILHDVGDFVRYEGHHKHSYYLIANSDVMGLSPVEREVVANVARYHRKSPPHTDHENFRALSREDRGRVKALAAILRIADALDREHLDKVTSLSPRVEGEALVLELEGREDRTLEEWTVIAKAGMMREAFGLEVRIEGASPRSGRPSRASAVD